MPETRSQAARVEELEEVKQWVHKTLKQWEQGANNQFQKISDDMDKKFSILEAKITTGFNNI